jgi:LemA protein
MVVVERYPDLKANQNFLQLQNQLEGTENRINVERNRFNTSAGDYNIYIQKIPKNFIASLAGFEKMSLYASDKGADKAPDVNFDFNKKE